MNTGNTGLPMLLHRAGIFTSSRNLMRESDKPRAASARPELTAFSAVDDIAAGSKPAPSVVYVGTLSRMVRFVKLFSLSTSIVGVAMQPFIYQNVQHLPIWLGAIIGGFAGFFIFLTPLILHFVTKRYVTRITLDRETGRFKATTYTFLLNEKHLEFMPDDVKVPNVPRLFATLVVNDKVPLFVDPSLFVDRDAFLQLMKYDEPLEWEIESEDETKKQPKK